MKKKWENLELYTDDLNWKIVYTDRNWVYNWLKLDKWIISEILNKINSLNQILNWDLKIVSNESEDNRASVLETDIENGLILEESNYNLSTQSAANFILKELWYKQCYYIWNDIVWKDLNTLWLNTINISSLLDKIEIKNIPILFARPPFAIKWKYLNEEEIDEQIVNDISLLNLIKIIEKLIFNMWKDVQNKRFNSSSYSQSRNEMQTKIITPFVKLIKQKKQVNLNIKVFWNNSKFFLFD
jgi:hypothetical protein